MGGSDPVWTWRFERRNSAAGPLADLRFAVKDLIAVRGCPLGRGNPHWASWQAPSRDDAPCVRALLEAGACCLGTTWLDEFAFGLSGENPWGGTPPNPRAPGRVTGGSSSGSAAAVALGAVDFALGSDTAGSVRVPASWCGLWGLRPSHGALSRRGVAPLAPSLDVVGPLADDLATLQRVFAVLLAGAPGSQPPPRAPTTITPQQLLWIPELWQLADPAVQAALMGQATGLARRLGCPLQPLPLAAFGLDGPDDLLGILQPIQWHEVERSLAALPAELPIGPVLQRNRELVAARDRSLLAGALARRERLRERLDGQLRPGGLDGAALLLLPVTPCPAPPRGTLGVDRRQDGVLRRLLMLGALAGLAGLPQLSRPGARVDDLPVGLGLIASRGCDTALLSLASLAG
ncbi:MAG: amidase family protein [Synechococcaceae cyanobacterium]